MTELETMTEAVFNAVNAYVERRIAPLVAEIAELKARPLAKDGEPGAKGEPGEPGKSVDLELLDAAIQRAAEVAARAYVEAIPKPKDGEPGLKGEPGEPGAKGEKGDAAVGEKGEKGDAGESVDMEALNSHVDARVAATVEKAVAALPRAKDGINGKDGDPGNQGADGNDGVDGTNGRDALEIEPLSSIDFARAYARRTYALHAGGLWICRRSQPGPESWECVVCGIADAKMFLHPEDERAVMLHLTMSDGTKSVREFDIPFMLHRGVWKLGKYEHGDCVTRNGSTWHAMKDTEAEPGASDDWQLIVKRGDRGKDAEGVIHNEPKIVRLK